jgi:hypothetical protein
MCQFWADRCLTDMLSGFTLVSNHSPVKLHRSVRLSPDLPNEVYIMATPFLKPTQTGHFLFSPAVLRSLILLLIWLRIGQMLMGPVSAFDGLWWLLLWAFHWQWKTQPVLSYCSLALVGLGLLTHWGLLLPVSAGFLGLLQLKLLRESFWLESQEWEHHWPSFWFS